MESRANCSGLSRTCACSDAVRAACHRSATCSEFPTSSAPKAARYQPHNATCPVTSFRLHGKVPRLARASTLSAWTTSTTENIRRLPLATVSAGVEAPSGNRKPAAIALTTSQDGIPPAQIVSSSDDVNGLIQKMLPPASYFSVLSSDVLADCCVQGALYDKSSASEAAVLMPKGR